MSWLTSFRVYLDRRMLTVLLLGFSSGLPRLLVYSTLSAWLTESQVDKATIGLFSWASTAYAVKWTWSPLIDRLPLPVLTRLLGQRRSWLLLSQIALAACMLGMGGSDPASDLWTTAAWSVALAFASATQDIVVDAFRVELLDRDQQAAGAGSIVLGYRIGMHAAGGGALLLADHLGWHAAYAIMAALMSVGVLTTLLSREPARYRADSDPDAAQLAASTAKRPTRSATALAAARRWLHQAMIAPLADFVRRRHWLLIVAFIALYKSGDAFIVLMANPFYLDIGFSKTDIAMVSKFYGVFMGITGGLAGGVLVARFGIMRALLVCGVLQAVSNLMFAAQAAIGPSLPFLVVTISVENLCGGMGTAAFVAYLSSLCNLAYTATQYALVSSSAAFARTILASGGGWLAGRVGWIDYFLFTTVAALPGLVLLLWMMRAFPRDTPQVRVRALADDD